jgi:hypothetical protein
VKLARDEKPHLAQPVNSEATSQKAMDLCDSNYDVIAAENKAEFLGVAKKAID